MMPLADFVPAGPAPRGYTARGIKANAAKAATWARLCADLDALPVMLAFIQLQDRRRHVEQHAGGYRCFQESACDLLRSGICTRALAEALRVEESQLQGAFCERFRTSLGYFRRFRRRALALDAETRHLLTAALPAE